MKRKADEKVEAGDVWLAKKRGRLERRGVVYARSDYVRYLNLEKDFFCIVTRKTFDRERVRLYGPLPEELYSDATDARGRREG